MLGAVVLYTMDYNALKDAGLKFARILTDCKLSFISRGFVSFGRKFGLKMLITLR